MDQAARLRKLVEERKVDQIRVDQKKTARIISVTSGKGGVGKTSLSVNLAAHLSKQGTKILLIDADLGLSNVEIMLGVTPSYTLKDVIKHGKDIEDVIINGPYNLDFISGGNGFLELAELSEIEREEIEDIYRKKGFEEPLLSQVVNVITQDKDRWVNEMMKDGLNLIENTKSPFRTGLVTFLSFVFIGIIPLSIYVFDFFSPSIQDIFIWSSALTALGFILIGYLKSIVTQSGILKGISETVTLGGLAALVAYFVGEFLGKIMY